MSKPLTVALITTATPGQPGSMGAYAEMVRQALSLHPELIQTRVVSLQEGLPQGPDWSSRLRQRLKQFWFLTQASRRLNRVNADIYHLLDGSFAYALHGLSRHPLIVTVHDLIPVLQAQGCFPVAGPGRLARWLIAKNLEVLRRQSYLCADSTCTAEDLRQQIGTDPRVDVIGLALRQSLMLHCPATVKPWVDRQINRERYLLHIGNNGFYKNRLTVAKVFAELAQEYPVKLVMAGAPPDAVLQNQLGNLIQQKRVIFIPYPDDQTLADLYGQASILLFPSYYEGFGWPPLEAMAFGCPAVCSNAGSLPEVVGDAALMAAPNDWQGLASQCRLLLENRDLVAQQIELGFRNLERFTIAHMAERLISLYQVMAGGKLLETDDIG